MELPRPLEPWRAWLSLLSEDLVEPLGQLLMQLQNVVGKLATVQPSPDELPIGLGDIVRRGPYERMLISEWAYADAEPLEFIRRAGGGELLFTGPEPEQQRRSHLSVALFDAGPLQLGEPRLAHLALFILLARRAEEAGAQFLWGIIQAPGALRSQTGMIAVRDLITARTYAAVTQAHLDDWNRRLDAIDDLRDCWYIAGDTSGAPERTSARIGITQNLLEDGLVLKLSQRRSSRTVRLALPAPDVGVRLIRNPFPISERSRLKLQGKNRPSLKHKPLFAVYGHWVATPKFDGGAILYHLPQSLNAAPGRPRVLQAPTGGSLLGAAVIRKGLSTVTSQGDSLTFTGFPGKRFRGVVTCPRPPMMQFRAPPGLGRWLPTFFLFHHGGPTTVEKLLMLDLEQQLVCWAMPKSAACEPVFEVLADKIIGVAQVEEILMYARCSDGQIDIHRLFSHDDKPTKIDSFKEVSTRLLFGGVDRDRALLAWQRTETTWRVGTTRHGVEIKVDPNEHVIGVALAAPDRPALLILNASRKVLSLREINGSRDLLKTERPIAQVVLDGKSDRICWLEEDTYELCVRELDGDKPLLRVVQGGDALEQ